jgi:hypothetical protein
MFAWGFAKGFTSGRHSVSEAALRAKNAGYEWAALELDDGGKVNPDDPDSPTFSEYNLGIWDEFLYHWHLQGMKAGGWVTEGGSLYRVPGDADLAIAEVEGAGDLEGVMNVIGGSGGGPLPTCPLAICTSLWMLNRTNAKPLIDAGFNCLTESYMNEAQNLTPDNMDRIARDLGWPTSQPVFGVYGTPSVPNPVPLYQSWQSWPGVDYLGEYCL